MAIKSPASAPTYEPVPQIDPLLREELASGSSPTIHNDTAPVHHASLSWIYVLCIANFGLSGAWALYVIQHTTLFLLYTPRL